MRYERNRRLLALLAALTLAVLTLSAPARTAPAGSAARLTGGAPGSETVLALGAGPGVLVEIPAHQPLTPDRAAAKKLAAPIGAGPDAGADWLRWASVGVPTWTVRATGGPVRAGRAPPAIA